MGDAYSHVRSAHRLSAGPRRSRGGCSGVAVAPTEEGVLWSLLLLRFSLCSCFGQEGGFFPPARRSGHIGIEAFRHIHIHRHRDIVKSANIRTNGFNRRPSCSASNGGGNGI